MIGWIILPKHFLTHLNGIFQIYILGNSLSVILFILSVNPLSFTIKTLRGNAAEKNRRNNIIQNFSVDDFKLYNSTMNEI